MAKKPTQTTAVTNWEEELAKQAEVAAGTQRSSGGGGKFFSMQGGILSFDGKNHEIQKGDPVDVPDLEAIT